MDDAMPRARFEVITLNVRTGARRTYRADTLVGAEMIRAQYQRGRTVAAVREL